jgi:UDP-glucose 4-epimerase
MQTILVVGGAGYIGSHMVKALAQAGYATLTLDNLSTGFADAVPHGELVIGTMADRNLLDFLFHRHKIEAVMHFAACSQVSESTNDPARYYRNNVAATQVLLDAMVAHDVRHLVFSSTAAVYGNPQYLPLDEAHPKTPINPYGRSKWMVEQMLADYDAAYGLNSIALRYFNAAGADPDGRLGERHDPETHLIPLVLQAGLGRRDVITVFGTDYDTADGTCIRDYIHIEDICSAHLLALQTLLDGTASNVYNLGNGAGFSVNEVIRVADHVLQRPIPVMHGERRAGDPSVLVADAQRAREALGWIPRYPDLERIIRHAAAWEASRNGLSARTLHRLHAGMLATSTGGRSPSGLKPGPHRS